MTIYQSNGSQSNRKSERKVTLKRDTGQPVDLSKLSHTHLIILQLLIEYRGLHSIQIRSLVYRQGSERSRTVMCQRDLRLLFDWGLVIREAIPVKPGEGRKPLVYFPSKQGVEVLAAYNKVEVREIDWQPKNNASTAGFLFLNHLLKTNDVRIALSLACEREQIALDEWLDDKTLKSKQMKDYVALEGESKVAVIPDGYCRLHYQGRASHFFLEIDLRTMVGLSQTAGKRDWARKIKTYIAYYKSGQYERRYQTKSLRILTITTTKERMHNLKAITEQVGGKQLFWFTTFDQLSDETMLTAPIWLKAGSEEGQENYCSLV